MDERDEAALVDELASIIERVSELILLAGSESTGVDELTGRLRRMGKHDEAEELKQLFARAEELKLVG